MINLNLLPPKHVFSQKEREIRRQILTFLVVFSAIFLLVTGTILLGNLYFNRRLLAYDQEQKVYQEQLTELSQLGWNVSSINFKVAAVKLVRANQHPFADQIARIQDLTNGAVEVSHVELSPTYEVRFDGSAKSRAALEGFLNKFTVNDPTTNFLHKVTIRDLQQQNDSVFGFSVSGKYIVSAEN